MKPEIFRMKQQDVDRWAAVNQIKQRKISQKDASKVLGVSVRQMRRIQKRVVEEGVSGLIHRLRGISSNHKINEKKKARILRIYKKRYDGFQATLASEKLEEKDGIVINRETLRGWLLEAGYLKQKQKSRKFRKRRERKECFGIMIQMDGSHHDWLEGRGPWLVIMGYIDDATNKVYARFYMYEGTMPAMDSFRRYAKKYGLPRSIYLDCHSTYKALRKDIFRSKFFEMEGAMSQFERSMKELGVKVIHAKSPQAKGRVERLFKTLQDRLVKELRLTNAKTLEEANEVLEQYLIDHNKRFEVEPKSRANMHRKIPKGTKLSDVFCIKHKRQLKKDNTVVKDRKLYQVTEYTSAKEIELWEHFNGTVSLVGNGRKLKYKMLKEVPKKKRTKLSPKPVQKRHQKSRISFGSIGIRKRPQLNCV